MPHRGNLTRIVEYALDENTLTATLVWSYSHEGVFSRAMGSAQRLSNGNTLIGWGWTSSSHVMATEVDPEGNPVFELVASNADGSRPLSYRAKLFAD